MQNIAYNFDYNGGDQVYEQWRKSPGHYKNMVKPEFNEVGYGFHRCEEDHKDQQGRVERGDRMYWTGLYVKMA